MDEYLTTIDMQRRWARGRVPVDGDILTVTIACKGFPISPRWPFHNARRRFQVRPIRIALRGRDVWQYYEARFCSHDV